MGGTNFDKERMWYFLKVNKWRLQYKENHRQKQMAHEV